jgi:hypothetical protein
VVTAAAEVGADGAEELAGGAALAVAAGALVAGATVACEVLAEETATGAVGVTGALWADGGFTDAGAFAVQAASIAAAAQAATRMATDRTADITGSPHKKQDAFRSLRPPFLHFGWRLLSRPQPGYSGGLRQRSS